MGMSVTMNTEGMRELQQLLAVLPDRIENRVVRNAGRKVAKQIADVAVRTAPRNERKSRFMGPRQSKRIKPWHTADKFTSVQRNYRQTRDSSTTVQVIGVQSGFAQLHHLFEFGTGERHHNAFTVQKTVNAGSFTKSRKVQLANGGWRTIKETRVRTKRFGTGTQAKAGGFGRSTGAMPHFDTLKNATDSVPAQQLMETEILAGLQRIAQR